MTVSYPRRGTRDRDVSADRVSVERLALAFAACRHLGAFAICGVVRAGADRGAGSNLMDARAVIMPLAELGTRLTWENPISARLALQLAIEADLSITTSQFDVDEVAVWRTSRFAGLAGAGLVMRFP